jgi:SAM-dependent methyltransferase
VRRSRRQLPAPRFELSDAELERIKAVTDHPIGALEFARLLVRAPYLISETLRVLGGCARTITASSALSSLVHAERARRLVPDAAIGAGWYSEDEFLSALVPRLGPDLDVLELGCGAGRLSRHVPERVRSLVCTDVSPAMVREAQRTLGRFANVEVRVTNGYELREFADRSFDLVFAAGVIGYVDPVQLLGLLDEVRRVLRDGGELLFSAALIDEAQVAKSALAAARAAAAHRRPSGIVDRPYCLAQIEALLRLAGLDLVEPRPGESVTATWRANVLARRPAENG